MNLFLTVPHEGMIRPEIAQFKDAATSALRARGWSLIYHPVHDRPTMAARNRQVTDFLSSPCDVFLTIDADCLPTRDGAPDIQGLMWLLEDIARPDVGVVGGWTMILRESHEDMVPCVTGPAGSDSSQPYRSPLDLVAPYSPEPMTDITGGGIGTHCLMVRREVLVSMVAAGRLPFEDIHCRDLGSDRFGCRVSGHDLNFCRLAADLGYRVWLDNRVFWGHSKPVDLRWVHDVVRDLSARISSHAILTDAFFVVGPGETSERWFLLRICEEIARCRGDMLGYGASLLLMETASPDRSSCIHDRGRVAASLVVIPAGMIPENAEIFLDPGACIVIESIESMPIAEALLGDRKAHIERIGRGAVIRC